MTGKGPVPFDFDGLSFTSVDVLSLARELLESEDAIKDGRTARTLAKSNELTLVLSVLRAGQELDEHSARGPVTILPILGSVKFDFDGEPDALSPGRVALIGKGRSHRVQAIENAAFLLLIGLQS